MNWLLNRLKVLINNINLKGFCYNSCATGSINGTSCNDFQFPYLFGDMVMASPIICFSEEELQSEIWNPVAVKDFEDCYEVSTLGRVRRLIDNSYNGSWKAGKIRNLSCSNKWGHIKCNLYRDGKMVSIWLHRLVLMTFIGNPPTMLHEVAHNDGNASNNRLSNLRWATSSENKEDCRKHGTMVVGSRHFRSKLKESDIQNIFNLRLKGLTQQQIADLYEVHRITVKLILQRRTWKHVSMVA